MELANRLRDIMLDYAGWDAHFKPPIARFVAGGHGGFVIASGNQLIHDRRMLRQALILTLLCTSAWSAEWMWGAGGRMAPARVEMSKGFELDPLPDGDVHLRVMADFCAVEVILNGRQVVSLEPYDPLVRVPVKRWLRVGGNQIRVRLRGVEGPSAVALDLIDRRGRTLLASGAGWEGGVAIAPLGVLRLGGESLGSIGALDEYNQWKEAKGDGQKEATFAPLPEGFELESLRAARPDEGSWISMVFDRAGRLIISKEKRGLLRFDLASGEMVTVEDSLLEVRGMVFAHGALYANANNSKGLYRLRDSAGDGRFDQVELLMKTDGGVGHGRNDLALGPDGWIYSIHGDSVKLPAGLSRRMPAFGEHGREQGYLIRCDADGEKRELVASGLRNPYGIAFNPDGEAFTYDADNEGDIGLPFYRPARVNHLVAGANYGWRQGGGQSWPVYHPDSLPTTHDAGRGSPTAVEFGTASHFPPRYRRALFILDWAYGRIIALDVIPRGASYVCRSQTFLRGRPLNVTDLTFGPDGAMYFITGGRGTQSALYRIRYTGEPVAPRRPSAQELAREEFSRSARALRRELERISGDGADAGIRLAELHRSNPDPWIRHAALVALARTGQLPPAGEGEFGDLSRYEKLRRLHEIEAGRGDLAGLAGDFPDGDPAVDRELSRMLVASGDATVVGKALAKLASSDSQFERLHYLDALADAKSGWSIDGRRAFFEAIRHPDYFRGDRNLPGYLKSIRTRAVATLDGSEREALGGLIKPAESAPALPQAREVVRRWTVEDLAGDPPDGYRYDPRRGREVFVQAACSRCHQAAGIGTAVGPNLSTVAGRFGRRDLIEAIVDPSRAMAEIFRNLIIKKRDGSTVVGRVVRDDFRASTISISPNPFAPTELTVVKKGEIVSSEPSPVSPMPPGLLDGFTEEEINHLLDFLQGAGGGG